MFRVDDKQFTVSWPRRCIACGKQMEEGSERYGKTYERIWIDRESGASADSKDAIIERHEKIRATLYICEDCKKDAKEKAESTGNKYEKREESMCKVSFAFFFLTIGLFAFQLMFPILQLVTFGLAAVILIIATLSMGAIWSRIAKRAELVKMLRDNPPTAFLAIDVDQDGKLFFEFTNPQYVHEFKKLNPSLNTEVDQDPLSW
ncbi:MAG: hypothetical protein GF309_15490 [Candidatus Lokiarchaeota archaeon]|nr:hypothetical protein [Candidatus Lokiarchaeota archaeon]